MTLPWKPFSRKLMPLVEYELDAEGRLTVNNDTAIWYRFMDMTLQAEALFRFIDQTIDTELVGELEFLANYDATRKAIQEIVDMPDRQIDLFIRFCLQNNGRFPTRKRTSHFNHYPTRKSLRWRLPCNPLTEAPPSPMVDGGCRKGNQGRLLSCRINTGQSIKSWPAERKCSSFFSPSEAGAFAC